MSRVAMILRRDAPDWKRLQESERVILPDVVGCAYLILLQAAEEDEHKVRESLRSSDADFMGS